MLAQVVEGHRPAREGMALGPSTADPCPARFPGEEGGWVSERTPDPE